MYVLACVQGLTANERRKKLESHEMYNVPPVLCTPSSKIGARPEFVFLSSPGIVFSTIENEYALYFGFAKKNVYLLCNLRNAKQRVLQAVGCLSSSLKISGWVAVFHCQHITLQPSTVWKSWSSNSPSMNRAFSCCAVSNNVAVP